VNYRVVFPAELVDFSCLDPSHFTELDGDQQVRRLASRYQVDPDTVASQ